MGTTTTLVSVQEFLDIPETEGLIEELIGGEVISMPRAGYPHEVTKSNIIRLVTAWSLQNPGWQPLDDPAVLPGFSIPTSAMFEGV